MTRIRFASQLLKRSARIMAGDFPLIKRAGPPPNAPTGATAVLQAMHSWRYCSPGAAWQNACFSSSAGNSSSGSPSSPTGSSSSGDNGADVVDQLSSMMEVMMQNPDIQQQLLARLPPHMQRPEVLQAMMADPDVRGRIAVLAQQAGLDKMFAGLDPSKMAAGIAAAEQGGLDPAQLLQRFQASPSLARRMHNPRVLAALMDVASNGPDAMTKYSGDQEVVEAAVESWDIMRQVQQEQQQPVSSSSSSTSTSTSSPAGASTRFPSPSDLEAQLGISPDAMMARLMQRPDLLQKFADPKVQQALQELSQKPWKIVKYMFDKDVMAVVQEMKAMVQPPSKT